MKINKLLFALLAGAMFTACTSDDEVTDVTVAPATDASGYVSIAIGLPNATAETSRANDDFDDGVASEYNVNTLAILFFEGREENAKFIKAYNVSPATFTYSDPANNQITSIKRATFPVNITQTSGSLWALAVVNYASVMSIDEDGNVKLTETASEFKGDIEDFMALTTSKNLSSSDQNGNFLMTNTPYSTAPGSGNNPPTGFVHFLALIDKEKIMETEEEAKSNPAATIYVERAVAKVTMTKREGNINANGLPKITSMQWTIDNTEPSTYIARHLVNESKEDATQAPEWLTYTTAITKEGEAVNYPLYGYRFVGNIPFVTGQELYRIYYGIDPNGDGIDLAANDAPQTYLTTNDNPEFAAIGTDKPQYCYENTFSVKNMNYLNTTRALIKVTFDGGTFYTRGIDRVTKYSFKDAAATLAHFVMEDADVVAAWTEHFETATTITMTDMEYKESALVAFNTWFKVEYKFENGRLEVKSIALYDGAGGTVSLLEGASVDQVVANVNKMVTFNAYEGGVSYYAVRIMHFGDDLTPWNEPKEADKLIATPTTTEAYVKNNNWGQASKNYLGRYGVLRNNSYVLNVTAINKFGEPTIGDLPLDGTPDDKTDPEQSISCRINILSWAKRSQDITL